MKKEKITLKEFIEKYIDDEGYIVDYISLDKFVINSEDKSFKADIQENKIEANGKKVKSGEITIDTSDIIFPLFNVENPNDKFEDMKIIAYLSNSQNQNQEFFDSKTENIENIYINAETHAGPSKQPPRIIVEEIE